MANFLYALLAVSEETVYAPKFFSTKDEAIAEMRLQFASTMEIPLSEVEDYEEESYDAMCNGEMAFCTVMGRNYNWAIARCDGIQFAEKKGE